MSRMAANAFGLASLGIVLAGCATTPTDQVSQTVYATHRAVQNINNNLGDSIQLLNENTAALTTRVNASDEQMRLLQSRIDENQTRLEDLQISLDDLTATLYRHFNLSPPSRSTRVRPSLPPVREDLQPEPDRVTVIPPDPISESPMIDEPERTQAAPSPSRELTARVSNPMDAYESSRDLYENGNYDGALRAFDTFLGQYGATDLAGNAQFWKAQCYVKLEEYESAVREFEKLRADFPENIKIPTAMHNEAVAYVKLGQLARAEELFNQVIEQYPMDAAAELAKKKLKQLEGSG